MLDEEMDDIIREAAEKHDPAYIDGAWNRMAVLLDKRLPQSDGNRKMIYFFLLLLGLGAGAYFVWPYLFGKDHQPVATANIPSTTNTSIVASTQKQGADPVLVNESAVRSNDPVEERFTGFRKRVAGRNRSRMNISDAIISPDNNQFNEAVPENKSNQVIVPDNKTENIVTQLQELSKTVLNQTPDKKTQDKTDRKKKRNGFGNNFGFSFSAGPDLSFVNISQPGKITLAFGAGLQYTFAKRITVMAGFYVSRKKYSTDSAGYHPPAVFWNYYPDMQNIEANCKVYDIPVSLRYQFKQKNKHSFFAGAGVSSYLMKQENYDYSYKSAAGQPYYRSYSYSNKNNHLFSAVTLSGGYSYALNKNLSFSAEPYLKIPLKGIGYGRVNLKGSGILFTVSLKPFAKKQ